MSEYCHNCKELADENSSLKAKLAEYERQIKGGELVFVSHFSDFVSLCASCGKANVSCPIYPQETQHCVEYRKKPNDKVSLRGSQKGLKMKNGISPEQTVPLDSLVVFDATHWLECVHAIGGHRHTYHMRCIPLKTMNDGRKKVLVFGDRYWKNRNGVKRIRYVPAYRVFEMESNAPGQPRRNKK